MSEFLTIADTAANIVLALLQALGLPERARTIFSKDEQRNALQTALIRAYAAFARNHPGWVASLFDETFLKSKAAIELLAGLLTRRSRPDPAQLARLYAEHLGQRDPDRWPHFGEATRVAADFLTLLEGALAEQPALRTLYDSRALEEIAQNTKAIREAPARSFNEALAQARRYAQIVGDVSDGAIVIGDHNVVTQVFLRGDYASLSDLYIPPNPVFERVRLAEFSGRAWLEAELDRFLSEHKRGVWLLEGEAGVGKTTFLAHLVQKRGYLHFFAEQAPGEAGVMRALQSLAAQLVSRYLLEPYTSREHLSASLAAAPDFIERLLGQAAKRLIKGEKLVIVVDALDEAGAGLNGNPLGLPKTLPEGVFLILSQRPVNLPLRIDPYPRMVRLTPDDQRNLEDVATYLSAIAAQLSTGSDDVARILEVLKERSAGNWMYLYYVIPEIQEGRRPEDLPLGLAGYYGEYWGRWRRHQSDWDRLYAPLLAVLAAAREAANAEQLRNWAGLNAETREVRQLLEERWAPFLFANDGRYRLYHASLRDFLSGSIAEGRLTQADRHLVKEMAERTWQAHRWIAEHYRQAANGDWMRLAAVDGGYGLRQLVAHLAMAGEWDALYALLTDFDFLEARCRATSVFDLVADYRLALDAWPQGDDKTRDVLAAFEERVRLEASCIARAPEWLFPALYNELRWLDDPLPSLCEAAAERRKATRPLLRSRLDPRVKTPSRSHVQTGHTDFVSAVAVSPDGRFIVSGSWDRTVKVWDAQSGALLRSLKGHTSVSAVAVSPDGRFIVSGSQDRTVKVWDAQSGALLRSLGGHTGPVHAVAVSPDGRFIVSGSQDQTVKVWDAQSGALLRSLGGHTGPVLAVAVSSDGRFIVSGSWDETVKVWDAQSGALLRSLEEHTDPVFDVAVSSDGRFIVSGSWDETVKVWDAQSGALLRSLKGHTDFVFVVAVSPDGRFIVSGSWDGTVKVWDAQSGALLRSLGGHTRPVLAVAVSSDGRFIVSGSWDETVKVWDAQSGALLRSLGGHTDSASVVAVSPDGRFIISGSLDQTVKVWDAQSGALLRSLGGHTDSASVVAVSPDGRFIISGSLDQTVKVWDAQSGALLRSLGGHTGRVYAVAVSPDGRFIVSGSWDGTVKVWDAQSGALLRSLGGHTDSVSVVAVSPDGRFIVSGSWDGTVKVWDAQSGALLRSLGGHTRPVLAVAVSSDGRFIVSGSWDGTVKVWDAQSGALLRSLKGHTDFVFDVAVSPDGRFLVSGLGDGTVKVWDAQNGELLCSLEGHTGQVNTVTVSPDGRFLVSGSEDHTIRAWNLQRRDEGQVLFWNDAAIASLALSRDGCLLTCGDEAGRMWIFDVVWPEAP